MVCLLPSPVADLWWQPTPRFIVHNDLGRLIPAGDIVVPLPFFSVDDRGLYAQAVSDMHFRLDDRWFQVIPQKYAGFVYQRSLKTIQHPHRMAHYLRRDICRLGADYVVVRDDKLHRAWVMSRLHLRPLRTDGLLIYRIPASMCRARREAA